MTNRIHKGKMPKKDLVTNRGLIQEIEVSHRSESLISISLEQTQAYIHIIFTYHV